MRKWLMLAIGVWISGGGAYYDLGIIYLNRHRRYYAHFRWHIIDICELRWLHIACGRIATSLDTGDWRSCTR